MLRKGKHTARLYTRRLVNRQHPINRQCYAWWMDVPHLSGSRTWYDIMGITQGTLNGFSTRSWGTLPRPGGFGSLMFDSGSYVDCGNTDMRYNFTTENFTLSFWVYANTLVTAPVPINRGTYATNGWYVYLATDGHIELQCESSGVDNSLKTGAGVVVINTWQHITLTRTGTTTGAIYVNGKAVSTTGSLGNCGTSTNALQIGQYNGGSNRLSGHMDDVRIYGRSFTASDAAELYNASRSEYLGVVNRYTTVFAGVASNSVLLNGALSGSFSTTGSATSGAILTGSTSVLESTSGAIASVAGLVGNVGALLSDTGSVSVSAFLNGNNSAILSATGTVGTGGFSGSASFSFASTGSLTSKATFSSGVSALFNTTGNFTVSLLAGNIVALETLSGTLLAKASLLSAMSATESSTATLTVTSSGPIAVAGNISGLFVLHGTLTVGGVTGPVRFFFKKSGGGRGFIRA